MSTKDLKDRLYATFLKKRDEIIALQNELQERLTCAVREFVVMFGTDAAASLGPTNLVLAQAAGTKSKKTRRKTSRKKPAPVGAEKKNPTGPKPESLTAGIARTLPAALSNLNGKFTVADVCAQLTANGTPQSLKSVSLYLSKHFAKQGLKVIKQMKPKRVNFYEKKTTKK
ncbi:MAG TPA: hypothetical protein VLG69_04735 [Candidatus Andersenbacteria bacterium]|nr:hypothetical protein [Candidatus Andersenbacteria bacterium]